MTEIEELRQEVKQLRRELQLMKLRRQATPHFLFNSISVAMSLCLQSPKKSVLFLRHMSRMYRYLLTYGNEYHVPIEQEIAMLGQYYELMSMRHVDCIQLNISKEVMNLRGYPLPPLSLQGLLENAIKHNTHTKEHPLQVFITRQKDYLCISNNMMPLVEQIPTTKKGLAYIRETMLLLFNKEIIVINDGKNFTVKIPLVIINNA